MKNTKKALLMSVLALVLCFSMLIGTTFAWFTDVATTGVNNIQSGTLDVVLEYWDGTEWVNAEGKPLNFVAADRREEILWEPGCTYELPLLRVRNNGNLALKYEIVITGLTGDAKLLEVIDWTINGEELVAAYTGELLPEEGKNVKNLAIVGHMKESAGNEYQGLTIEGIGITVYATQQTHENDSYGDTYDENARYVTGSGVFVLLDNIMVVDGDGIVDIYGSGKLEDLTGLPAIEKIGSGEMNVDGIEIKAGATGHYAIIIKNGNANFVNSDIHSLGGGFSVTGGASATFESGSICVATTNSAGRYNFYVVEEGSNLTIEGGNFSWEGAANARRAYIYAGAGTTVHVKGGNFGKASTRSDYKAGIMGEGTVIITGGTFGFNPSKWVATGYKAVENANSTWTVVPETVNAVVNNADELQKALDKATGDYTIYVNGDIVGDVTAPQAPDVTVTIEGNGHKFAGVLLVDGKSGTYTTAGLTIKDLTFKADSISADACIQLGKDNSTRYTCNVTVENCTFDVPGAVGIKSYTGGDKNLTISGCTATGNAHSLAQLKGVDGVLVENCTVEAVRGINLNNSDNVVIKGSTFNVEKYAVRFGESNNSVVENYAIIDCALTSACVDGDAVIVLRAGATNANLTLTNTVLSGSIEMTGHESANITVN